MQVLASVNESDIGRIRTNMPVRFKVNTYPGEVFRGTVSQIRLDAVTTGDVVTYTVVVSTDNSDERLLPSLTASLQFEVNQRAGVLLVPNAALRWRPRPEQVPPELRDARTVAIAGDDGDEAGQSAATGESKSMPGVREGQGRQVASPVREPLPPLGHVPASSFVRSTWSWARPTALSPK